MMNGFKTLMMLDCLASKNWITRKKIQNLLVWNDFKNHSCGTFLFDPILFFSIKNLHLTYTDSASQLALPYENIKKLVKTIVNDELDYSNKKALIRMIREKYIQKIYKDPELGSKAIKYMYFYDSSTLTPDYFTINSILDSCHYLGYMFGSFVGQNSREIEVDKEIEVLRKLRKGHGITAGNRGIVIRNILKSDILKYKEILKGEKADCCWGVTLSHVLAHMSETSSTYEVIKIKPEYHKIIPVIRQFFMENKNRISYYSLKTRNFLDDKYTLKKNGEFRKCEQVK